MCSPSLARSRWAIADNADTVESLAFTAKMSKADMVEGYKRLRATFGGNDPSGREVKLCYVTVRLSSTTTPLNWP